MAMPDTFTLQITRIHPDAVLPVKGRPHDAAYDLACAEAFSLQPGERAAVGTGLAAALPAGTCGLVCPRSGLAAAHGITVVNAPGVIDANYRGEVKVILLNTSAEAFRAQAGDRIAQLLVSPALAPAVLEADELPPGPDSRGEAGFGSSGR